MLEEVCMAFKTLEQWGFGEIKINLNMSAVQLQHESVVDIFEECITIHNIQPRKLVLEITESTLQSAKARKSLSALKSLGMTISIDDFGTGFSCISELANETYDAIKLDRSLLPDFPLHDDLSKRRALIIKNVVGLCRFLDMPCTIEGLETEEQVEFAKEIGATAMQGYRFARPLSLRGLMEYLQENHAATVVKTVKL
jgi:EAL domain-containing protein (putative c-di-GMP-specific phosphodiesterase class I)